MENWNEEFLAVEVERKLAKHNRPETTPTAQNSKLGIGTALIYFVAGIALIKIVGELLSFFF